MAYAAVFSGSIFALEDEASEVLAWEPQFIPAKSVQLITALARNGSP
ncbi:hypothetical protein SAMN04489712_109139 [Thermomonospora echinospora]|uniref:Uncharacterized protein n=1 Tax=Thermomonospora echinospora TaxID=1992 RepID=A0A1H6CB41_9ACTN|nr:hypothetical protein SAMN04489712_109139 [Thermomonospora echinospora]